MKDAIYVSVGYTEAGTRNLNNPFNVADGRKLKTDTLSKTARATTPTHFVTVYCSLKRFPKFI